MRFRKLRIAWSVFWGMACMLLIVLWVRSYWIVDMIKGPGATSVNISLDPGTFGIGMGDGSDTTQWTRFIMPSDKYLAVIGASHPPSRVWGYSAVRPQALALPFWFLALITVTLGASPWIRWRRFSLRTLLIATTFVAVVLGTLYALSR